MAAMQPELSARAVLAGLGIGALLAIGNLYVGLKTSWWDSGNVTAALLGFALMSPAGRLGRRPYSLLENNITQTVAGAVAIVPPALGLLGALPALQLLGHHYSSWAIGAWGLALALFGVLLAVPLRHRYVVAEPLPFPSALATAEVIRAIHASSDEARRQTRALLAAAILAMAITWFRDGRPSLIPAALWLPVSLAGTSASAFTLGLAASPLLVGAGMLVGPRIGFSMLAGAIVGWLILAPRLVQAGFAIADYTSLVGWLLWPAVTMMVTSGLLALLRRWRAFTRAVTDLGQVGTQPRRFWAALGVMAAAVVLLSWLVFGVPPLLGLVGVLVSLVLIDVCVRTAGETDIAPLGALGQLVQLGLGLLAPGPAPVNVATASITAGAGAEAALTVNVLKAGHQLGASPGAQLRVQALGAVVGVFIALPAYALFTAAHGLGSSVLPAPGALGWKALAALASTGTAAVPPWAGLACALAAATAVVLTLLEGTRAGRFLPSPIALAVAFLVPATTGASIALGALILVVARRRSAATETFTPPLAAGAIAGEALLSLVIAILIATGVLG
jgi:uncharacterized oligopeptide transporter (OPT) family protein